MGADPLSDDPPAWLPPLLRLEDFDGEWERYFNAVKAVFSADFEGARPTVRGRRVGLKRMPLVEGMTATFWHFISEGKGEADRRPDLRRCERIGWPRALILAIDSDRVCVWEEEDPRRGRKLLVSLLDYSYLLVLDDRGDYLLPWTAYRVEHEHGRDKLRRRHEGSNAKKAEAAPKDGLVTPSTRGG